MLEEQSFQHVVSWGPQGDCFVVKVRPSSCNLSYETQPTIPGHERIHKINIAPYVQTLQFRQLRPTTQQVRLPQGT
jgi:hypothetical protein